MFASSASAIGSIAQSFSTPDSSLTQGSLVSLKSGSQNVVEKASSGSSPLLLGVTADTPLIALGGGQQQAKVVVSGLTPALVSNINGDIKIGDRITASPIEGVGMKATISTQIVGVAESNLADSTLKTDKIRDNKGTYQTVKIGTVDVQVGVTYYVAPHNKLNDLVPTFLINVGSAIAGKDVSPLRILIGFCALLIGFATAGIMLQAGVRSGIISLGRNPLAGGVLRRSLLDVLVTSVGLLSITVVIFYLVLST